MWAMFFLALSILMKKYGVILVLPYVLVLGKDWKKRSGLAVFLGLIILLGILPFLLHSPDILHTVLQKKAVAEWAGLTGETIEQLIKTCLLGVGYLWVLYIEWRSREDTFHKFVRVNAAIILSG